MGLGRRLRAAGRPRRARVTCAGTRAAELALRLKYAGVPAERLHVVPELAGRARRGAAATRDRSGCSCCPPTRRCSSCATSSPRRGHVGQFWEPSAGEPAMTRDLARPRMRRYARGPAAVARRWPPSTATRSSTSAPGTGRVALDLARAGHAVDRARQRRRAARRARRARAGELDVADGRRRRPRLRARTQRFALCIVPMQTIQLLGGAGGRARVPAQCAARTCGPAGVLAIAIADELELFEVADGGAGAAARHPRASTASSTRASRPRSAPTATASCSSAGARRSPPTASAPSSRT